MKIYHTETQADYDALMVELEEEGCKWFSGRKPTEATENWKANSSETCVRVDKKVAVYDEKSLYTRKYPDVPIIEYKAKADEKMKFTKENIYKVFSQYRKDSNYSLNDLQDEILKLDDTPEKVVVPKYVADYLEERKRDGDGLVTSLYPYQGNSGEVIEDWFEEEENNVSFAKAWIDGYTIESDTVTEQRYTVVIADRYLVQLFIGRTDYRFVEFDELCAWNPSAFQLTEAEIKAIDERYWTFAAPAKKVTE